MPSIADKTHEQKLQEKLTAEMARISTSMQLATPITIRLSNGKECQIGASLISRMSGGDKYTAADWISLCEMLLSRKAPMAVISVGRADTLPAVKDGEIGFWIREVNNNGGRCTQWCISVYKPSSSVVTTYAVRAVSQERSDLSALAVTLGVLPHALSSVYHQETADIYSYDVDYQDSILFDMLLDIATGAFTPHLLHIGDGKTIQCEILQALEQLKIEAEAAAAECPNKRRRTIKERLAQQTVKEEH